MKTKKLILIIVLISSCDVIRKKDSLSMDANFYLSGFFDNYTSDSLLNCNPWIRYSYKITITDVKKEFYFEVEDDSIVFPEYLLRIKKTGKTLEKNYSVEDRVSPIIPIHVDSNFFFRCVVCLPKNNIPDSLSLCFKYYTDTVDLRKQKEISFRFPVNLKGIVKGDTICN